MDLRQLEIFVARAETRNVQQAADRVFATQPGVSMAIRRLENELGAELFDRSTRTDKGLTPAGAALYTKAKQLLSLRDEALSEIRHLCQTTSSSIEAGR